MSHPIANPPEGLLFWSILFREDEISPTQLRQWLDARWPAVLIYESDFIPQREYYAKEMGEGPRLVRWIAVSLRPKAREELIPSKREAYLIEQASAVDGRRRLNIDPGIVCLEHVLLSTYKPYAHRIFVADGVFLELCLQFVGTSYRPLSWTYPDYADIQLIEFFHFLRSFLKRSKLTWKKP